MTLREDKLLHGLAVYFFSGLLQFLVVEQVQAAGGYDARDGDEEDVGVVCRFSHA